MLNTDSQCNDGPGFCHPMLSWLKVKLALKFMIIHNEGHIFLQEYFSILVKYIFNKLYIFDCDTNSFQFKFSFIIKLRLKPKGYFINI